MSLKNTVHLVAFMVLTATMLAGCGGDSMQQGTDEGSKVAAILLSVNDAAESETSFKACFVGGAAPADRAKYYSAKLELVGEPNISGSDATAQVKVTPGEVSSEGNNDIKPTEVTVGEVTWTLQKDGEFWKLKDAPLP